ncbi:hypothetical protein EDB19DRAFT_1917974 [Suillus lakei]|nr:hypothetical protein EDB19DRAFT_1917974 [Suillus lakei]
MSTFNFTFSAPINEVTEWLNKSACVPDNAEDLEEEHLDWMAHWVILLHDMETCLAACRAKGLSLHFSAEEITKGVTTMTTYNRFTVELAVAKEEKVCLATIAELQTAVAPDEPMEEPKGKGKKSVELAGSEPEEASIAGEKVIWVVKLGGRTSMLQPWKHEVRCAKCTKNDHDCYGFPGVSCLVCKHLKIGCLHPDHKKGGPKARSVAGFTASGSRVCATGPVHRAVSSPDPKVLDTIEVSEEEEPIPVLWFVKWCPVPVPKGKKKMAVEADDEGEAEEPVDCLTSLANSALS